MASGGKIEHRNPCQSPHFVPMGRNLKDKAYNSPFFRGSLRLLQLRRQTHRNGRPAPVHYNFFNEVRRSGKPVRRGAAR